MERKKKRAKNAVQNALKKKAEKEKSAHEEADWDETQEALAASGRARNVDGVWVNLQTSMPTFMIGGNRYHVNTTTATYHVSQEGSPMVHFFYRLDNFEPVDAVATRAERGGGGKKKFSDLPGEVQEFLTAHYSEIWK